MNSNVRMTKASSKKDEVYEDDQLNYAPYEYAINKDMRSYLSIYWSFLKYKQLCIFTFFTKSAGILRSTKIVLFILFIAFYMAFTALFFNDNIMRSLYIYKGNTDAAVHVPNIILSSLCSLIASLIVRFVCLSERDISKVITLGNENERQKLVDKMKKRAAIKIYALFICSIVLTILCWYYVSAFCAIFKNSQIHYLINVLVAFIVCNIWPCVTTLIAPAMRKYAFKNDSSCMYKASQIVAYI